MEGISQFRQSLAWCQGNGEHSRTNSWVPQFKPWTQLTHKKGYWVTIQPSSPLHSTIYSRLYPHVQCLAQLKWNISPQGEYESTPHTAMPVYPSSGPRSITCTKPDLGILHIANNGTTNIARITFPHPYEPSDDKHNASDQENITPPIPEISCAHPPIQPLGWMHVAVPFTDDINTNRAIVAAITRVHNIIDHGEEYVGNIEEIIRTTCTLHHRSMPSKDDKAATLVAQLNQIQQLESEPSTCTSSPAHVLSRDDSSWHDSTRVCCSWRRALYRSLISARPWRASLRCSCSLVQTTACCVSLSQDGDKYSG